MLRAHRATTGTKTIVKRHIAIGLSACLFAALAPGRAIGWVLGVRRQQRLTSLYYHAVPRDQMTSFARQMQLLSRYARVVDADWQGDPTDRTLRDRRYPVAITFDDAFESVLQNALPNNIRIRHARARSLLRTGCLGVRLPGTWKDRRIAQNEWLMQNSCVVHLPILSRSGRILSRTRTLLHCPAPPSLRNSPCP